MKRKLLSVLFTLGMIVCLCGALALTSYATVTEVDTEAALNSAITNAANGDTIKLTADIDLAATVTIPSGKTVTLDLNGQILNGSTITDANNKSVITNNGTLTITDSGASVVHYFKYSSYELWTYYGDNAPSGSNIYTANYENINKNYPTTHVKMLGGVIYGGTGTVVDGNSYGGGIFNNGTLAINKGNIIGNTATHGAGIALSTGGNILTITGGLIAGNKSLSSGGGVFIPLGATFLMQKGEIGYNNVKESFGKGGAVYNLGNFTMDDGEIIYNKAGMGAGVYIGYSDTVPDKTPGKFTMNGGKIAENRSSNHGGGVYVDDYADVLIKGTISDNYTNGLGGGVCCYSSITVSGNAVINGNRDVYDRANNVFLCKTISKAAKINVGTLDTNAQIGVSLGDTNGKKTIGVITETCTENDLKYFFSDIIDGTYLIYNSDNKLEITSSLEVIKDSTSTWFINFDDALSFISTDAATIKLHSDLILIKTITIEANQTVTIDLNDNILNGKGINNDVASTRPMFINNGSLSIVDNAATKSTRYFTDELCHENVKLGEECYWCDYYCDGSKAYADSCFETYYSDTGFNPAGLTEGTDYIKTVGGVITGLRISLADGTIVNNNNLVIENINIIGNTARTGAIKNYSSTVIRNSSICGNTGDNCGAICNGSYEITEAEAKALDPKPQTIIEDSTVKYNGGQHSRSNYGAVYNCCGKIIVGGKTVISENNLKILKKSQNGLDSLVTAINIGCHVELGDGSNDCKVPEKGMKIGVTNVTYYYWGDGGSGRNNAVTGAFVYECGPEDYKYFYSTSQYCGVYFVKGDKTKDSSDILYNDHLEFGMVYAEVDFGEEVGIKQYPDVQQAINEAAEGVTNANDARTVKILNNVELKKSLTVAEDQYIILDLDGYVINGNKITDEANKSVIINNGYLKITDGDTEKVHYFEDIVGVLTYRGDTVPTTYYPNNIHTYAPTNPKISTIKEIENNTIFVKILGGAITGGSGSMYLLGGNSFGGGILNCGTLEINNVNIVGNSAGNGGGIYNDNDASLTLINTIISHNSAKGFSVITPEASYIQGICGGVYSRGSDVTVGGNLYVKNNKAWLSENGSSKRTSNFGIDSEKIIKIASGDNAPKDDMYVGITIYDSTDMSVGGVFTDANDTNYIDNFHSEQEGAYILYNSDKKLEIKAIIEVTKGSDVKYFTNFKDALEYIATDESTIRLLADINIWSSIEIKNGQSVTLDLNGFILNGGSNNNSTVIYNYGTLTIKDSNASNAHYFNYVKNGAWTVNTTADSGINVSDITSQTTSGTVIKITGGTITGNKSTTSTGGAVYNNGILTVNKINIIGNNADGGGAIYNYKGNNQEKDVITTVLGSTFCGNYSCNGAGGAILNDGAELTVIDSKIKFNTAYIGGGIVQAGTLKVGGDTEITDNESNYIGYSDMIVLNPIEIGEGEDKNSCPAPGSNMKIGVLLCEYENGPKSISGRFTVNGTAEDAKYFYSTVNSSVVYNTNGYLELSSLLEVYMKDIGTFNYVTFTDALQAIYDAGDPESEIKLLADIDLTYPIPISKDQNITIDLNDHILNGKNVTYGCMILNEGTLSIVDKSTEKTTRYFTEEYCVHGIKIGEECEECIYLFGGSVTAATGLGIYSTYYTEYDITGKTNGKDYIKAVGGVITGFNYIESQYTSPIKNNNNLTIEKVNIIGNLGYMCLILNEGNLTLRNCSIYGNMGFLASTVINAKLFTTNTPKAVIENSEIKYNTSTSDSKVCVFNAFGELILGGNTKITDNKTDSGENCNLLVNSTSLVSIGTKTGESADKIGNGVLAPDNMKVGVKLDGNKKGQFTNNGTENDAKYFFSSSELYKVVFVKGDSEAQNESLKVDHLELVDRITEITEETKGIIPDNVSTELAIKIAKDADITKNATSGYVVYARAAGGKYKCIYRSGANWVEDTNTYTFNDLKGIELLGVIGEENEGCKTESELYADNNLMLVIGGKEYGKVDISKGNNGGWVIYDTTKKQFVGLNDSTKQLKYSDTEEYEWKYDGTGLYTEIKVTVKTRILFFYRKSTTTERFYLTADGVNKTPDKGVKVVKYYDDHDYSVESKDRINHTWTCSQCGDTYDEEHTFKDNVCIICGAKEKAEGMFRGIEVSVETKVVSRKLADIIKGKNKAYTVKITPYGDEGVYATEIKYTLDGGETWSEGDSFVTYNSEFEIDVQVTDNFGTTKTFTYSNKKKK